MDINRNINEEAIEILNFMPVLGIVGSRQTGKTTLSKQLASQLNKEVVHIDLENPVDVEKIADPILYFRQHQDKCVIIDEVQHRPELFQILRPLIDEHRVAARFILLGSAAPTIIRGASESLAGRIAYLELSPFILQEIDDLNKLWYRGGYPLSYLAKNESQSATWRTNYIRTYVERDLPMLGLNLSATILRQLWTMLAHIAGNLLNASMLAKSLGVTQPSIMRYLHFMEETFLIRRLPSFHINMKKRLVKAPKLYLRDTGLLHSLLGITHADGLQSAPWKGHSWENFVIEQIISTLASRYSYYYYRTHQGAECDLVLVDGITPKVGIEIKYASAPKVTKGFLQSIEDLGTIENYIIYVGNESFDVRENVKAISIGGFLKAMKAR
ncbi:MAG: ATP-binding protein [Cytophagales bacterium]|nr:ATP-binding protein [Cytophagales bacterium]